MLAAVLRDFNRLELEDVPRPVPEEPGSVVVRIRSCGICQTDYKAIKGIQGCARTSKAICKSSTSCSVSRRLPKVKPHR